MNINSPNIEYFQSYAEEIKSKFRRLQNLIRKHNGTSGDYHEELIRSVVRNFLPSRFSVRRGFIFKSTDEVSRQLDIMIIDENYAAAYIFQEGDFAIVSPKAVTAVIEVKTTLNASDFETAVKNVHSAKNVMDDPTSLTGIIFGYDGTQPSEQNLSTWFRREGLEYLKDHGLMGPDSLLFFSHKTLLVKADSNARIGNDGQYYHRFAGQDDNDFAYEDVAYPLSVILAQIINACQFKGFKTSDKFKDGEGVKLMQAMNGGLSLDRYSFGRGFERITVKDGKIVLDKS